MHFSKVSQLMALLAIAAPVLAAPRDPYNAEGPRHHVPTQPPSPVQTQGCGTGGQHQRVRARALEPIDLAGATEPVNPPPVALLGKLRPVKVKSFKGPKTPSSEPEIAKVGSPKSLKGPSSEPKTTTQQN
ncbi:uncharacterized protein PpBr36_10060 [Pyricularia pennisetigena]|uniref:uncharacterized protein n=1 Tax=Pyricularia pennisetigena TaxID=1578925 RepID=UPI001151FEB1|nr:uncharacterized protein PpBr36_10060 [Pyricularia pennisetigena]TLS22497.1 hypothetical protein PpBr36_10060 [Pyricularia pennisetigena]